MHIEFKNWLNQFVVFRDNDIIYHSEAREGIVSEKHRLIPYESITKCSKSLGTLVINTKTEGFAYSFSKEEKAKVKEAIAYVKTRMVSNPTAQISLLKPISDDGKIDIIDKEETKFFVAPKMQRRQCKNCGHIIYFTDEQLEEAQSQRKEALLNSLAAYGGVGSGNYAAGAVFNSSAEQKLDKANQILDLSKCPKCFSKELTNIGPITIEEYKKLKEENKPALSSADEIKKFKELLDMSVITEEEFNAKKKELLGL